MVLALTITSFLFFYLLYLPKVIVNEAIDTDASAFPVEILGVELGQIEYLLALCATFLGLDLVNGGFKYFLAGWSANACSGACDTTSSSTCCTFRSPGSAALRRASWSPSSSPRPTPSATKSIRVK